MIGIVAVSHSLELANAAVALASQMTPGTKPPIAVAAGTADGEFGTDAMAIVQAIEEVASGGGVVVVTDLGSAILSSETALEFLPDPDMDVRIVPAPFVEGLMAAAVESVGGGDIDAVARAASTALEPKVSQLGGDAASDSGEGGSPAQSAGSTGSDADVTATARIVNPNGLHARPAAAVAERVSTFDAQVRIGIGDRDASASSPLGLAGLGTRAGDEVEIRASGTDANEAVAAVAELIASGFGEAGDEAADAADPSVSDAQPSAPAPQAGSEVEGVTPARGGLGVSAGRVVGEAVRMRPPLEAPDTTARIADEAARDEEAARLRAAVDAVSNGLAARADASTGEAADVLRATAALASDPEMVQQAEDLIRSDGMSASAAVWQTLTGIAAQFTEAGGALAARATDVADVRSRIVAELEGVDVPGVPERDEPFILVAHDLAPVDTAGIDPSVCLGILTEGGGPTSHTAILARALGIPAVVAAPVAADVADGERVLIDGATGEVVANPTDEVAQGARTAPEERAEVSENAGPGATSDGHRVQLLANIGGVKDVRGAVDNGAEGIGLYRTEFDFLSRAEAPTADELRTSYRQVFEAFPGQKVVVRTLDAGSDKPLAFIPARDEENPALGERGFRTASFAPEILRTQLQAIADAASETSADPWVMAPMISTVQEAAEFERMARDAGLRTVGVMVETPSIALMTAEVFEVIDFVSLGTNDLAQYTMAADRQSAALAALTDPWQPALLRLIGEIGRGANGKPMGVCGEAASDPLLAPVLVGLGVNSLSMTPRALHAVRQAVSAVTLEQCQRAATAATATSSPDEARAAAQKALSSAA